MTPPSRSLRRTGDRLARSSGGRRMAAPRSVKVKA